MTEARLGLAIDSGSAARAAVDLDKLPAAAGRAEAAFSKLGSTASASLKGAGSNVIEFNKRVSEVDPIFARLGQNAMANSTLLAGMGSAGSSALGKVEVGAKLSGNQIAELGHIMRSTTGTILAGGSAMQALGYEANRLVSVLTIGQGGVAGTLRAVGGLVGSALVSPLGVAAIAAAAAATAIVTIFSNERSHAKAAEDALKTHIELIGRIKNAYEGAADGVRGYANESVRILRALDEEQRRITADQLQRQALQVSNPIGRYGDFSFKAGEISPAMHAALVQLNAEARAGQADWKRFGEELLTAVQQPGVTAGQHEIGMGMVDVAAKAAQMQGALGGAEDAIHGLGIAATNEAARLDRFGDAISKLAGMSPLHLSEKDEALNAYRGAVAQSTSQDERTAAAAQYDALTKRIAANDNAAAAEKRLAEATRAGASATRSAAHEIDAHQKAIEDLNKSLDLEHDILGKSAADRRVEIELRRLDISATSAEGHAIEQKIRRNQAEADALDKLRDRMEFEKDLTRGIIDDVRSGLKNGEDLWTAFGDAATNALDKITDKLLDDVLDAIFKVNDAGAGGGGGGFFGFLSGLFGGGLSSGAAGLTGAGLFARGAAFSGGNVIPFARGGIVSQPTLFPMARGAGLMGEAGPEAVMPLRRGSDGRLGIAGGSGTALHVHPTVTNNAADVVQAETRVTQRPDGGVDIETRITKMVDKINQSKYGLRPAGRRMGLAG